MNIEDFTKARELVAEIDIKSSLINRLQSLLACDELTCIITGIKENSCLRDFDAKLGSVSLIKEILAKEIDSVLRQKELLIKEFELL